MEFVHFFSYDNKIKENIEENIITQNIVCNGIEIAVALLFGNVCGTIISFLLLGWIVGILVVILPILYFNVEL